MLLNSLINNYSITVLLLLLLLLFLSLLLLLLLLLTYFNNFCFFSLFLIFFLFDLLFCFYTAVFIVTIMMTLFFHYLLYIMFASKVRAASLIVEYNDASEITIRLSEKAGSNTACFLFFFSIRVFFTDTDDSQDSRRREGTIFHSTLPLPPAHEH